MNQQRLIAVVGATGNVGRKVVALLLERQLVHASQLKLFASSASHGSYLTIDQHEFRVEDANQTDFSGIDVCVFNTESPVSARLVPKALSAGAYVVDSSSHYRLDPKVPLIVPPINHALVVAEHKLYAHANCLTSPIATVLNPLHQKNPIQYVNIVSYQATSGAGKRAVEECWAETIALVNDIPYRRQHFKRQIALNVIPQVGEIQADGISYEEYKIIHELKKVLGQSIAVSVTAVRVPVLVGHAMALTINFENSFELEQVIDVLNKAAQVELSEDHYSTPVEVVDSDAVFVGRLRPDLALQNGLQLWLCSDNLRRGAATDAVEIIAALLKKII